MNRDLLVWALHSQQPFKAPLVSFEPTPMQARLLAPSSGNLLSDVFLTRLFTDVKSKEFSFWRLLTIVVAPAIGKLT